MVAPLSGRPAPRPDALTPGGPVADSARVEEARGDSTGVSSDPTTTALPIAEDRVEHIDGPDPGRITGSFNREALFAGARAPEAARPSPSQESKGLLGVALDFLSSPIDTAKQLAGAAASAVQGGAAALTETVGAFAQALAAFSAEPTKLSTFVETLGTDTTALLLNQAVSPQTYEEQPAAAVDQVVDVARGALRTLFAGGTLGGMLDRMVDVWTRDPATRQPAPEAPEGIVNPHIAKLFSGVGNDALGVGLKNAFVAAIEDETIAAPAGTKLSASIHAAAAEVMSSTPPDNQAGHVARLQEQGRLFRFLEESTAFESFVPSLKSRTLEAKRYLRAGLRPPLGDLSVTPYNGAGTLLDTLSRAPLREPVVDPIDGRFYQGSLSSLRTNAFDAMGRLLENPSPALRRNGLAQRSFGRLFTGEFDNIVFKGYEKGRTMEFLQRLAEAGGEQEGDEPQDAGPLDTDQREELYRLISEEMQRKAEELRTLAAELDAGQLADRFPRLASLSPSSRATELLDLADYVEDLLPRCPNP